MKIKDFEKYPESQGGCIDVVSSTKIIKFFTFLPFMYLAWLVLFYFLSPIFSCILTPLYIYGFIRKLLFASLMFPIYFYGNL